MPTRAAPSHNRTITAFAAIAALLLMAALVSRASTAAFVASDDNDGNFFAAAAITVTADSASNVLFEVEGMVPGQVEERCILVTFDGDTEADLAFYADIAGATGLESFIDFEVDRHAPGTFDPSDFDDCGDVGALEASVYSGTLGGLAATATDFASGLGSHQVDDGDASVYVFTAELQSDNAAQGQEVTDVTFTWEAQTS